MHAQDGMRHKIINNCPWILSLPKTIIINIDVSLDKCCISLLSKFTPYHRANVNGCSDSEELEGGPLSNWSRDESELLPLLELLWLPRRCIILGLGSLNSPSSILQYMY